MDNPRRLAVLEAANLVEAEINRLIDASPRRLIHAAQLRKAVGSISFNIREGVGRGTVRERNRSFRTARGEAEEAIGELESNLQSGRLAQKVFWRLRDRLVTIIKMIDSIISS